MPICWVWMNYLLEKKSVCLGHGLNQEPHDPQSQLLPLSYLICSIMTYFWDYRFNFFSFCYNYQNFISPCRSHRHVRSENVYFVGSISYGFGAYKPQRKCLSIYIYIDLNSWVSPFLENNFIHLGKPVFASKFECQASKDQENNFFACRKMFFSFSSNLTWE